MKIVQIRPLVGGVAHVAERVAATLRAEGHTIHVILANDDGIPAWSAARQVWRHRRQLRGGDVIYVELGRTGLGTFWVALWASYFNRRMCVVAHDPPYLAKHPGAGLTVRGPGLPDIFAYKIVAAALDPRLEQLFTRRVRSWGVFGAVGVSAARRIGLRPVLELAHGSDPAVSGVLPEVSTYVLFAGTVGESKGLDVLLEAWAAVRPMSAHELRIVGNGRDGPWLEEQRRAAASVGANWIPDADDVAFRRHIADAAVVVLPYRSANPASGVLVHALAENRPIVASQISPFDAAVVDHRDGILVPPGDSVALAAALNEVLADANVLAKMGRYALSRPKAHDWVDHARGVLDCMASAMGTNRQLHITQPTDGGTAAVLLDLVSAALEMGVDVTVVSPADERFSAAVLERGVSWHQAEMQRQPTLRELRTVFTLRRHMVRAGQVVLHSSKAGALGRVALMTIPRRSRPSALFMPHGWSWLVGGRRRSAYLAVERALSLQTDRVVAVSHEEAAEGRRLLGRRVPIVTIENGVDTAHFRPGPGGMRQDQLVVCVGRLSRQKGQDLLVRALVHLPCTTLRLIGDGPDRQMLEAVAEELGVRHRVEMIGHADPLEHLQQATVVAVPSRWEGLPLTLLEAMACGAAVLPSRAAAGALFDGVGASIDSGDDPVAWSTGLACLLDHPDRRRRVAEAGMRHVHERYQLSDAMAKHSALWRELRHD